MSRDPSMLTIGAIALSSASITAALMRYMRATGRLTMAEEREIYIEALTSLEESQEGDQSGVFKEARELIEAQLQVYDG